MHTRDGLALGRPRKLDHFRVTTLERGPDGNYLIDREVHDLYGDRPRVLPVRLLYDAVEGNFQWRYACYIARRLWCAGDGREAQRLFRRGPNGPVVERRWAPCPCARLEPGYQGDDPCRINGVLSVIIDGMDRVGGVWKLRTASYNSVLGILSSLALIKRITGGPLAGIPLELILGPKSVAVPSTGHTTRVWVVGLEFRGTMEELERLGLERAERRARQLATLADPALSGNDPERPADDSELVPDCAAFDAPDPQDDDS